MISEILKVIEPELNALPWIDQYGGVVKVVEQVVGVDEYEGKFKVASFPVSCSVTQDDCWSNGQYRDLVPDDRYKSVSYFEHNEKINFNNDKRFSRSRKILQGSTQLVFVAWLNLKKLGHNDCDISPFLIKDLNQIFNRKVSTFVSPKMKLFDLKLSFESLNPRSANPFEKYDYEQVDRLLLYPYDYISLDVNVEFSIAESCLNSFVLGAEIDC